MNKLPLDEALDAWEEKALKERECGLAGNDFVRQVGMWGQKLEHTAMAVEDKRWQVVVFTNKDMAPTANLYTLVCQFVGKSSHFYAQYLLPPGCLDKQRDAGTHWIFNFAR